MATRRRDRLLAAVLVVVIGTIGGGLLVRHYNKPVVPSVPQEVKAPKPPKSFKPEPATTKDLFASPLPAIDPVKESPFDRHFRAAVMLLQAGRNKDAIEMLELAHKYRPHIPELHVNLGFAHLGLDQIDQAIKSFETALSIRPRQINAYYGLASSLEKLGDVEGALGAMRTYVHLSSENDPFRTKAMSATWEWQTILDGQKKQAEQEPVKDQKKEGK